MFLLGGCLRVRLRVCRGLSLWIGTVRFRFLCVSMKSLEANMAIWYGNAMRENEVEVQQT